MNEPLPLTSPNWWPLTRTLSHVYVQAGHGKIADYGFLLAVNQNRVRVKLDQLNLRNKPPALESLLLPPGKYELEAHIHNTWMLRQCDEGRRYLRAPYAMFFWAPDVKKVWPSDTPEGSLLDTPEVLKTSPATTTKAKPDAPPVEKLTPQQEMMFAIFDRGLKDGVPHPKRPTDWHAFVAGEKDERWKAENDRRPTQKNYPLPHRNTVMTAVKLWYGRKALAHK